ncbi:MAG TPA: hypothetical protein VKV28_11915 [Candidatus Binataceae bacterium]|nr:hypothetical protein [Candidatus Binataceae bacterium]
MATNDRTGLALIILLLAVLAPGTLWAQATIIPTPAPTPAPAPTATPAQLGARSFYCNCAAFGQPVSWAGQVQALNYFLARQTAGGECLAYLGLAPQSPYIAPPVSGFGGAAAPQGTPNPYVLDPLAAAQIPQRPPLPANNPCASCACN